MKRCIKCNIEKDIQEFRFAKTSKDKLTSSCKSCERLYKKIYNSINKDHNSLRSKLYDLKNKEAKSLRMKEYRLKNKEQIKLYQEKNKEKIKIKKKEYYNKNKKTFALKSKEYNRKKKKENPLFKLKANLRTRTNVAFKVKYWKKTSKTIQLLGESFEFVHNYIEIQFKKGMTWENYGEWHIDHKIPLASAKTKEELIKLFHYTNLQPLWAIDNINKKDKIIEQQLKLI